MTRISSSKTREIIDNFAKEIRDRRLRTAKPSLHVINFRDDIQAGKEREVVKVPIELLRYRKDNGRISSDVLDYTRNIGPLDERDDESQAKIREFLEAKDPEKTSYLRKSIRHEGQRRPAIITCDGFLINGNRRKMVMENLLQEFPNDEKFKYMKVVILPGKDDEGGPPTLVEIEKIENRYQLQHSGKSEYYGFDRALSIKRKIEIGLSLKEQLRDDPVYANVTEARLKKEVKNFEKEYLKPLERVEKYLRQFRREGEYRSISSGKGDPEGRWQAFKDWSNSYHSTFKNRNKLNDLEIDEDEVGAIEEAAFDIIRLRKISDMPKVHNIMRDLPKYCGTKDGKKEIKKIADDVDAVLPPSECSDDSGNPLTPEEIDAKWASENREKINYHVRKAANIHQQKKVKVTPLELLEAAYKKLTHEDMDLTKIDISHHDKARSIVVNIRDHAIYLEKELYQFKRTQKKLKKKR